MHACRSNCVRSMLVRAGGSLVVGRARARIHASLCASTHAHPSAARAPTSTGALSSPRLVLLLGGGRPFWGAVASPCPPSPTGRACCWALLKAIGGLVLWFDVAARCHSVGHRRRQNATRRSCSLTRAHWRARHTALPQPLQGPLPSYKQPAHTAPAYRQAPEPLPSTFQTASLPLERLKLGALLALLRLGWRRRGRRRCSAGRRLGLHRASSGAAGPRMLQRWQYAHLEWQNKRRALQPRHTGTHARTHARRACARARPHPALPPCLAAACPLAGCPCSQTCPACCPRRPRCPRLAAPRTWRQLLGLRRVVHAGRRGG